MSGDNAFDSEQSQRVLRSENWARAKAITRRFFIIVSLLMLLWGLLVVCAPALEIDPTWSRCEVYSAEPIHGGTRVSSFAVRISTSCGEVWVNKGVGPNNVNQEAA